MRAHVVEVQFVLDLREVPPGANECFDARERRFDQLAHGARVRVIGHDRAVARHDHRGRHGLEVAQHRGPVHRPGRADIGQRRADQDVAGEQDALLGQPDGRIVR